MDTQKQTHRKIMCHYEIHHVIIRTSIHVRYCRKYGEVLIWQFDNLEENQQIKFRRH